MFIRVTQTTDNICFCHNRTGLDLSKHTHTGGNGQLNSKELNQICVCSLESSFLTCPVNDLALCKYKHRDTWIKPMFR